MSTDYFGALLRSAGRPVDGAASVHAPVSQATPATPASPGADLVEIDATHEAQRPGPGAPAAQKPQPAAPSRKATASAAAIDERRRPDNAMPEVPAGQHGARPAAPEVIDLSAPPLHSAVQAALAWVASDPQGRGNADAMPEVLAESTRVRAEAPMDDTEKAAHETDAVTLLQGNADDTADDGEGPPPGPSHSPATGHRPATPPAADRRMRAARAPAPSAREEVIEITIGAIHLHVDAPPQAGIAPAPPPAAPSLRSPTPRSALSRRALYRL